MTAEHAGAKTSRPEVASGFDEDDWHDLIAREGGATPAEDIDSRYVPLDWAAVWASTQDGPDWLVQDVIERGRIHTLFAAAKAGKSLLTLDMVAALAAHRPLLGRPNPHPGPVPVVYVDLENAAGDLCERLTAMGYGPADLGHLVYYSFPDLPALDSQTGGAHLRHLVDRHKPELVVIDTVSRVIDGEENSADTFRQLYRHALAPIKALGVAIWRLDHEGKDPTAGSRGSSAKRDDADTVWRLIRQGDGPMQLHLDRQRSNHHPAYVNLHLRTLNRLCHVQVDTPGEERVTALILKLDQLGMPSDAGRERAAEALRAAGEKVGSRLLERVVKARKTCPQLPGAGASENDHVSDQHYLP